LSLHELADKKGQCFVLALSIP